MESLSEELSGRAFSLSHPSEGAHRRSAAVRGGETASAPAPRDRSSGGARPQPELVLAQGRVASEWGLNQWQVRAFLSESSRPSLRQASLGRIPEPDRDVNRMGAVVSAYHAQMGGSRRRRGVDALKCT